MIYAVFLIVVISLFFNTQLGDVMYLMPVMGVLVLYFTKAMNLKEIVGALTGCLLYTSMPKEPDPEEEGDPGPESNQCGKQ